MAANRLSTGREGSLGRTALRDGVMLGLIVVAALLVDRWGLPDTARTADGGTLRRCRVVTGPPWRQVREGEVFVRPTTGPTSDRAVPAAYAAEVATHPANLIGADVWVEFPAGDGKPVVRAIARDRMLLALAAILVGLMSLVAGRAALRLLPALVAGLGAVLGVLVPCLLSGVNPLLAAMIAATVLFVAAALLIGRASRRSLAILAGAFGGLAVVAGLSLLAVRAGRLTGVYSPLTTDLWYDQTINLNFRQLLAAGMIVGACGIILDLAVAVTGAVSEVARADPGLPRRRLAAAGLAVGRDVMGTELNTLIFAYAGANFGVLLLPSLGAALLGYEIPAFRILSQQEVAAEILQMLAGTTALVLTIPISAAAAAMLLARRAAPAGSTPAATVRQSTRALWKWALCACLFVLAWIGCWLWQKSQYHLYGRRPGGDTDTARFLVQARAARVEPPAEDLPERPDSELLQKAEVVLTSGPLRGRHVAEVPNAVSGFPGNDKVLSEGDDVLLQIWVRRDQVAYATVIDFDRGGLLVHMGFVLIAAVLLVGRGKGLRALLALGVSAAVLYPAVLLVGALGQKASAAGAGPAEAEPAVALPILLAASLPLCVLVFVIIAGWGRKALAGALATFGGLLVGGLCALAAARAMRLSGAASDAMAAVRVFTRSAGLDYRGLLQAGMVLSIAGAGMDVAMAVVSAVQQVRLVRPAATRGDLFNSGLEVGRGIMVPMVLVLTLAFLGLSLPVLLLPARLPDQPVAVLISNEQIAVHVLRIIVGAVGVVCTVPIAAVLAAGWFGRRQSADRSHHAKAANEHRAASGR